MFCTDCGARNPEEARFCNQCGKPISSEGTLRAPMGSLEGDPIANATGPRAPEPPTNDRATALIQVNIRNKRYQQGEYDNYIWWDAVYTPIGLLKPTRAIKGVVEFADLFGEVHFRLKVVINEPIQPGKALATAGIGFNFNQFMEAHRWMYTTGLSDMKITFRAQSIIYADGTTEAI